MSRETVGCILAVLIAVAEAANGYTELIVLQVGASLIWVFVTGMLLVSAEAS